MEDHLTPHERSRPHPAPVDSANYFSSITQRHHLAKTFDFQQSTSCLPHRSFFTFFGKFPNFLGFFLGGLRLRRVTGVNDQLTNRESCLFCFVGQHEERKKKQEKNFPFCKFYSSYNFRAVNAEEPEHHGQVLKEEEENNSNGTSFDETFTHAGTQTRIVLNFCFSITRLFVLTGHLSLQEKRNFGYSSFFSNSTGKSNHQPDRKFNGNSSRRFTYTGACYVLGKLLDFNSLSFKVSNSEHDHVSEFLVDCRHHNIERLSHIRSARKRTPKP